MVAHWLHSCYSNNFIEGRKRNNRKKDKMINPTTTKIQHIKSTDPKLDTSPKVLTRGYIRVDSETWNAEWWLPELGEAKSDLKGGSSTRPTRPVTVLPRDGAQSWGTWG